MKKYVILTYLFLVGTYSAGSEIFEDLPQALWNSAKENNCVSVVPHISKIETHDPPYVFNILKDGEASAAYICNFEYKKIVLWKKENKLKQNGFSCSPIIQSDRIDVGGMKVVHGQVDFSELYELNQKKDAWNAGPDIAEDTFMIELSYDGLRSVLACHNSKWYFNNYD
ncbi:MAG: hypothetical protein OEY19_05985 [Gammaproteobacteria bacterium]|nr:hypothetical protein [Gammaproteobacteria bacterium]